MMECSICLCDHKESQMYTIKPCGHCICRASARRIVQDAIKQVSILDCTLTRVTMTTAFTTLACNP